MISPTMSPIPFDTAWNAVASRDPAEDGRFVFAVRTTGVFCRPSCPARRPRRENVRFFSGPAAAAAAGYRPCLRCRPEATDRPDPLAKAKALLEAGSDDATLAVLARKVGLSPSHLQRTFKARFGLSPREFVAARRRSRLKEALRETGSVSRAIYDAGFSSSSAGYQAAVAALGMTPGRYAKGGAGLRIRYQIAQSSRGPLLAATTDRGVCAVLFGPDEDTLVAALRAEFVAAELVAGADQALGALMATILQHLDTGTVLDSLVADPNGTPFQHEVWSELRRIPAGATRFYSDVARAIGRPRAVRAVATAIASNRLALVVPCHRVVRGNGDLGGYRWGPDLKRQLIAAERRRGE